LALRRRGAALPAVLKLAASARGLLWAYLLPIFSRTHLVVKLVFAAPESFFSDAVTLQALLASLSHFCMKLERAAPASFFSAAVSRQLVVCA